MTAVQELRAQAGRLRMADIGAQVNLSLRDETSWTTGLLDPDATVIADGGGIVSAALRPIEGREQVVDACVRIASLVDDLRLLERTVNGRPGLVAQLGGATVRVYAFHIVDDVIKHIWAVRNPEKLRLFNGGH
ncbi:hypothetical protein [Streptomyces sp. TS71-3]|uniref:hypothetical protein n=1 Tax=Streptomyces sp. TS71-3 TaxID=2733862 RepID=UPI001B1E7CBF|nr:hypothetical protein [Streptomyces sp. TS71-3]GHJ35623.1 hypothetical protein Sm713_12320 [Streptomyces sp. TS71-3]